MRRAIVILAATVPLTFVGIIIGKTANSDAELDATIAGGLVAILGAIVAGIFNLAIHISDQRNKGGRDE